MAHYTPFEMLFWFIISYLEHARFFCYLRKI